MANNEVLLFLRSIGGYWWAIFGGGVVSVGVMLVERRRKRDLPWPWLVGIMSVALLISCFLAWRDVYRENESQRQSIATLTAEKSSLQGEVKALREEMDTKRDEIAHLTAELSKGWAQAKIRVVTVPASEPQPPAAQALRFSQEEVSSDAPNTVRVTIQNNVTTMPTSLMLTCDTPIVSGEWELAGVVMTVGKYSGYTEDRRGYWIGLKETPFKPETPIVATLTATRRIRVLSVKRVPWP